MAKINKTKKIQQSGVVTNTKKIKKKINKKDPKPAKKPEKIEPVVNTSESDSDDEESTSETAESESEVDADNLKALLEPYSKEQLIDLVSAAAVNNSALHDYIREAADRDVTHRKIFVHGLGWDTTQESLAAAFESCGEIEECKLVTDKVTGKAKGFAFIVFKTRKAAEKALKTPQRKVNNRMASCQLASLGPTAPPAKDQQGVGERKIYVSSVPRDVDKDKLREFFERFGEIETGPFGFDVNTGKSRGFAIFVYRSAEGARKALEEPFKMFQGNQLHCQKAAEGKNKTNNQGHSSAPVQGGQMVQGQQMGHGHPQGQGQGQGQDQSQVLAAMAAAQNLALFGQHPGLNPVYGGLLANTGLINPMVAGALNQGVVPTSHVPVGGMGGLGGGNTSVLGTYGTGQHVYPNAQDRTQGTGGTFPGYTSSYMWYVLLLSLFGLLYGFYVFVFMNLRGLICDLETFQKLEFSVVFLVHLISKKFF